MRFMSLGAEPSNFYTHPVLSYGLLPLVRGFDLAYATEIRTGVPFSVVNAQQQLIEPPGSRRFPMWFTLNTHKLKSDSTLWATTGSFAAASTTLPAGKTGFSSTMTTTPPTSCAHCFPARCQCWRAQNISPKHLRTGTE